jgi:hypothetical protein
MPDFTVEDLIRQAAKKYGVPEDVALSVAAPESGFNPGGKSPKGAVGVMQLSPATAKQYGVDPADPIQNIDGGVKHLRYLYDTYKGNLNKVLAAYNAGEGTVARGGTLPAETQKYIPGVLGRMSKFQATPAAAEPAVPAVAAAQAAPAEPAAPPAAPPAGAPPAAAPPVTPPVNPRADPRLRTADATKPARVGRAPFSLGNVTLGREVFPMAGTMIGAAKGAEFGAEAGTVIEPGFGTAVGGVLGGIVGAGIGAFGGEGFELSLEALAKKLGYPFVTSKQGAASRIAGAPNTGMAAEVLGQAGVGAATRLAAPFVKSLEPYAQESLNTFKTAAPTPPARLYPDEQSRMMNFLKGKAKPPLAVSPAEVSKSRALNFLRNWSERSIFGSAGPQEVRQKMAEDRVLDVLDNLGPATTAQEAGRGVQASLPPDPAAAAERVLTQATEAQAKGKVARAAAAEELQTQLDTLGSGAAQGITEKLPTSTPLGAGQAVRTARAEAIRNFRNQERTAWGMFEEATQDIPADTSRLNAFVEKLPVERKGGILPDAGMTAAQRIEKVTGGAEEDISGGIRGEVQVLGDGSVLTKSGKRLPSKVEQIFKSLGVGGAEEGEEGGLTVKQFQKTISDLNRLQRNLEKSAKFDPSKYNAQLGLVKKLNELAHSDLQDTLTKLSSVEQGGEITPGSPLDLYRKASTLTRLGNEQLFNQEVMKVTRQAPEKVAQSLLTKNNSTAINLTTSAVGDAGMQPVRRVALNEILTPDPTTNQIPWEKVLQRMTTLGDDTLGALFPKGEAEGVKRIARSILDAQASAEQAAAVAARGEVAAISEARAGVKAAQDIDPFAPYRHVPPQKITSMLFKDENVEAVTAMRNLLGPEGFKPIQRVAADRILEPNAETGQIDWKQVVSRINGIDDETLHAFFPGTHADEIKRVAGLMVKLAKPPAAVGSSAIMLGQMGVIIGFLRGVVSPALAPITLTPKVIARIFGDEAALKWLTLGIELPPWSKAAMRATAQLAVFLHKESQNERENQAKQSLQQPARPPAQPPRLPPRQPVQAAVGQ